MTKTNGDQEAATLAPLDLKDELPIILRLAERLAEARSTLPRHCRTVGDIVATILAGRELGLPPMTSLRMLYAVDGRIGMDASLILALLMRGGVRHKWIETNNKVAVIRLERPGHDPLEFPYGLEDANRAKLLGKDNWKNHPAAMLRARCVSAAARAYAPDLVAGIYVLDELDEIAERPGAPTADTKSDTKAPTRSLDAIAQKHAKPAPEAASKPAPAETAPEPPAPAARGGKAAEEPPQERPAPKAADPAPERPRAAAEDPTAGMVADLDLVQDDTQLKRWIDAYRGPLRELRGEARKAMGYAVVRAAERVGVSEEQVRQWVNAAPQAQPDAPAENPADAGEDGAQGAAEEDPIAAARRAAEELEGAA